MKDILRKVRKFLRDWHELITLPIAMLLWVYSPTFLRWIDPTAASYDAGIFQIILFAIIELMVFNAVVWIIIKLTFPDVYKYLDEFLEKNLKYKSSDQQISIWEKSKLVLWLFTLYFAAIVLLARAI
jgi:hypothetical protein